MKTIAFYSYKGGTGKSLMAANLAVCLSRIGKNCLLVDCDLESPSLHIKFGQSGIYAPGKGGFIGFVASHFDLEAWNSMDIEKHQPRSVRDVREFVYTLEGAPWDRLGEEGHGPAGTIHLLPAGDIHHPVYWQIVWSRLWHEMFTAYHRWSCGDCTDEAFRSTIGFFQELKRSFSALEPRPDYLIVDLRPGACELSTSLVNAWVDTFVYTFSFNEDSVEYFAETFSKVRLAGKQRPNNQHPAENAGQGDLQIELALCRVPAEIEYRGHTIRDAMDSLRLNTDDLHVVHSDRDLEIRQQIRCGYMMRPQNRRVTHDYVDLFSALIEPRDFTHIADSLGEAIGIPDDFEETERIFRWESTRGALINPNDESRNVSLKVETFQLLLRALSDALGRIEKQGIDGAGAGEQLRTAGKKCGQAFGKELSQKWQGSKSVIRDSRRSRQRGWNRIANLGVHAKIQTWCDFDSDVGFGRFELDPNTIHIEGPALIACDIYLRESFLTPGADISLEHAGHSLCELMCGYVEGVISEIIQSDFHVTHRAIAPQSLPSHPEKDAVRSESCLFELRSKMHYPDGAPGQE